MSTKLRAILAITALFLIAIFANWLMRLSTIGNKGLDLTEDQRHTLSDGTRAILAELDAPVTIRYYASRGSENMPRDAKLYMKKVDALLRDYRNLAANGQLRIENFDPRPDTDAEDAAVLDGISGQRLVDGGYEENIFLGLSVTCLDQKTAIPFLDPSSETMLEYELSRAIAEVSRPAKPTLGLISALPLSGGQPNPTTREPGTPPWLIYSLLEQNYQIQDLGINPTEIDPAKISTLLLIHPNGITPATEYAIDQFLLRGGNVIACLDPHCLSAPTPARNPLMGMMGGGQAESTLPTLLPAWGIDFDPAKFLADLTYASPMQNGATNPSYLNLPSTALISTPGQEKEITTQDLTNLFYIVSGSFSKSTTATSNKELTYTPLLQSSTQSGFLPTATLRIPGNPNPFANLQTDEARHHLTVRLSGKFQTAFPQGNPTKTDQEKEIPIDDGHLKEAAKPGTVLLIPDADFLNDQACYASQEFSGQMILQPITDNPAFFFNSIDQLSGSPHLIGARSRTSSRRPFTLLQEMEAEHQKEVGAQIQELETQRETAIAKLQELQAQKSESTQLFLSPAQEAEVDQLEAQQVEASQAIRAKQKKHKKQKDALTSKIVLANLGIVPAAVLLFGFLVHWTRRAHGRTR